METNSQIIRVLSRNILASWSGHLVAAIVSFLLTPFVLAQLGLENFGVWALISGFTGYYGLLDIGFRSGLTRYITKYLALKDFRRVSEIGSTGTAVLVICGLVVFLATLVVVAVFPLVFNIPLDQVANLRWAILLLGSSIALQFPLFVQSAVFVATQRFDISNSIGIAETLCRAATTIFVLRLDWGIIGLAASVSATSLVFYSLRFFAARRLLPNMKIAVRHVRIDAFNELFGFSVWSTISTISSLIIETSDIYVIAALASMTEVARFELAVRIANQFRQVFSPFSKTIFPTFVHLSEKSGTKRVGEVYCSATYVLTLFVFPVATIGWGWAPEFYDLWLAGQDPQLQSGTPPASIFRLLIIAASIRTLQIIGYMVFHTFKRLKLLTTVFLAEAACNVILSVVLFLFFNLWGVAAASVISAVIFQLFIIPFLISQILNISLSKIVKNTIRPALAAYVAFCLGAVVVKKTFPSENWTELGVTGLTLGIWLLLCLWFLGLPSTIKKSIVAKAICVFRS